MIIYEYFIDSPIFKKMFLHNGMNIFQMSRTFMNCLIEFRYIFSYWEVLCLLRGVVIPRGHGGLEQYLQVCLRLLPDQAYAQPR